MVISNNRFISGGHDETIRVWNMYDYLLIKILNRNKDRILCLMSLENGHRLLSVSCDKSYKIWDMNNYN
jgi:WD40 repeat protein